MVIEVPKPIAWALATIALVVACTSIGYVASPRAANGRPVLLSPAVRTVETYRRSALGWAREWRALVAALHTILQDQSELISTSQNTQQALENSVDLARNVDAAEAPASLIGLRDQATAIAGAFVNASLAVADWVSAPSVENKAAAENKLSTAEKLLRTLETNEWLRDSR